MLKRIKQKFKKYIFLFNEINDRLKRIQESLGRIEARQVSSDATLANSEFRVFSQWGEDGVLQKIFNLVPIDRNIFVEFGVQNYTESNTRFLLINDNWAGLIIDSDANNIDFIRKDPIYWAHNLKSECAFIKCDNINELISSAGISGDIGLLSIDIDGNDYWIWNSISCVSPRVVVIEYNFRFGDHAAVTIPYNQNFSRSEAHYSMIYYGCSLAALEILGKKKGYSLVHCNLAGNNAFFVRDDIMPKELKRLSASEAYKMGQFRECRDEAGNLTFLEAIKEVEIIKSLPLIDVSEPVNY